MQTLTYNCDRCREDSEHPLADLKVHWGGNTFGSKLTYEVCSECLDDLRKWVHTRP